MDTAVLGHSGSQFPVDCAIVCGFLALQVTHFIGHFFNFLGESAELRRLGPEPHVFRPRKPRQGNVTPTFSLGEAGQGKGQSRSIPRIDQFLGNFRQDSFPLRVFYDEV